MKSLFNFLSLLIVTFYVTQLTAQIQYTRQNNKDGIHTFEPSKMDATEYTGFKLQIGGAFTQRFQSLQHENVDTSAAKKNKLYALGNGFNLAAANLNYDVQLGDGIRMFLENYMASRHHNEFWVKGGYIQIDKLPMFGNPEWYTKYFRTKIGHMEVNYGDQHFRRSDGGNTIFNPFVENNIMDQFATEIGGEVYAFPIDGLMLMFGMTNGIIRNNIFDYSTNPAGQVQKKSPAILLKAAYEKKASDDLTYRLSVSMYSNSETLPGFTLFSGDRTGSNSLPGYVNMKKMMGDHASSNIVKAQASKDATMAYFILKYFVPGSLFIHYNGSYHSDNHDGIVWYLKQGKPVLKIVTVTTVSQADITKLDKENKGKADFIICVDEDMTTTY